MDHPARMSQKTTLVHIIERLIKDMSKIQKAILSHHKTMREKLSSTEAYLND
jgi:hypothetical protein